MNITKEQLINSIFYPRQSNIAKDNKDHLVEVEKNIYIGIRMFLSSKNNPTILFFHGNAELAQEYDEIGEIYNQYNMNFIVADYRGYGLSNGDPTKNNLHSDSLVIFDYVKKFLNENNYNSSILVMGRSLGSASAAHIINNRIDEVDGCVIESGFATEYPLLSLMNIDPESMDFSLEDGFNNLEKFKSYNKPLYIIHSDLDEIIPFSQAEMILLECNSTNKDLFKVNGAGHNNILSISREHYFHNISSFIKAL